MQTEDAFLNGYGTEIGDTYVTTAPNHKCAPALSAQTHRNNTVKFSAKLKLATSQRFHTSTDAHKHYHATVPYTLHSHFNYTQLLKSYSYLQEAEPRRYSLPSTKTEHKAVCRNPNAARIRTLVVDRHNTYTRIQTD